MSSAKLLVLSVQNRHGPPKSGGSMTRHLLTPFASLWLLSPVPAVATGPGCVLCHAGKPKAACLIDGDTMGFGGGKNPAPRISTRRRSAIQSAQSTGRWACDARSAASCSPR